MAKYARWAIRLIGPALLIWFLWNSNFEQLIASFGKVNIWFVLLSLALMPVFVVVKAWRWSLLLRELNTQPPKLSFLTALYTIGLFYGGITPGQAGDFIKGWYLRERGVPLSPVLFSIVLDRLFDFIVMALLALLALLSLSEFRSMLPATAQIATIAFACLVIVMTPLMMAKRPREWVLDRMLPLLPARFRASFERLREQFATLTLRPGLLAKIGLASLGSATSTIIRIWLLFLSLSLTNIPFLAVVSSTALIAILQALPISFSGIGVREAVLIPLLARYGYQQELALVLSALFLLINIEHIVIGFLVSLRYPLGMASVTELQEQQVAEAATHDRQES